MRTSQALNKIIDTRITKAGKTLIGLTASIPYHYYADSEHWIWAVDVDIGEEEVLRAVPIAAMNDQLFYADIGKPVELRKVGKGKYEVVGIAKTAVSTKHILYVSFDEVIGRQLVLDAGIGLVHGSNFSVGMNLFFEIATEAARIVGKVPQYDAFLSEAHHRAKKDAPSGTALNLLELVRPSLPGREPGIAVTRAGHIPGIHVLGFDSEAGTITLSAQRAQPPGARGRGDPRRALERRAAGFLRFPCRVSGDHGFLIRENLWSPEDD